MPDKKEPMIGRGNRPSAIDYDAPISNFKLRDLVAVINSQMLEYAKYTPAPEVKPEHFKPEQFKPEGIKPEKEFFKGEKELRKPEKEIIKVEKELIKPEKEFIKPEKERLKPELTKPEKEWELDPGELVNTITVRVLETLKQQGLMK
jgi:hypothetical protein